MNRLPLRPNLLHGVGEHLITALFPRLPKCCRYKHKGKYLTSYDRVVVYNVNHNICKEFRLIFNI